MADNPLQAQQDQVRLPVYGTEGFRLDWPLVDQTLINCFAEVVRNPITGDGDIVATKRGGIYIEPDLSLTAGFTAPDDAFPMANVVIPTLYDVYVAVFYDSGTIRVVQYRPQVGPTGTKLLGSIVATSAYDKIYVSHGWQGDMAAPTNILLITWESSSGTSTKGYYCLESSGQYNAATLTQITAAQYPSVLGKHTRGPIVQLNNQFYVATLDGKIYGTGTTNSNKANAYQTILTVGAEEGWRSAIHFIVSISPDQFYGLIRYKHHILALGKTSIQFYSASPDANLADGVAIVGTDQAFIKFGVLTGKHVVNVDDIIYWVAYGKDDTTGLWKLEGYTPVKVSTKRQDNQIQAFAQNFDFVNISQLFVAVFGSKKHIGMYGMTAYTMMFSEENLLGLPTDTQSYPSFSAKADFGMYNIEDKTWWYMGFGANQSFFFPASSFGNPYGDGTVPYKQYILKGALPGGGSSDYNKYLYAISNGVYLDSWGGASADVEFAYIPTFIQFNTVQFGTERRKRINKAKAIMGVNFPRSNPQTKNYSMNLSWSKQNVFDAYSFTQDINTRAIGIPNSSYRYYWNNLGMVRSVNFVLSELSDMPMVCRYLELDLAQGTG